MNALLNVVPTDEPRKRTTVGLPDSLWERVEKMLKLLNANRLKERKRALTRDEFFEYGIGWVLDELDAQRERPPARKTG